MAKRTPFPGIFWIANSIEILERFAYYGIYMGFGIYMDYLGYSRAQLGIRASSCSCPMSFPLSQELLPTGSVSRKS
jgi:hypothetical protein